MDKFETFSGIVAGIDRANIDTDAIIPKQYLKSIKRTGFGVNLFDDWRYLDPGEPGQDHSARRPNPDFVLNRDPWRAAEILLAVRAQQQAGYAAGVTAPLVERHVRPAVIRPGGEDVGPGQAAGPGQAGPGLAFRAALERAQRLALVRAEKAHAGVLELGFLVEQAQGPAAG